MSSAVTRPAFAALLAAVTIGSTLPAAAQPYPSQPVKLVVAFAPGGPADLIARILGQKLNEQWKQPVVIENRGGAGGNIAAGATAKAEPNGYTVLVTTSAFAVNPSLSSKAGYNPADFTTAIVAATTPNLIVGAPSLKAKTLRDVIEASKTENYTYGTAGVGTTPHLSAEKIFRLNAKVTIVHAPFTGAGPALNSVMGGHTALASVALPAAMELVKGGQVKALAVTSKDRMKSLPDVPTARELGLSDDEDATWVAFMVPAQTPPAVVAKLNDDINTALADSGIREQFERIGFSTIGGSSSDSQGYVKSEITKWGEIIRKLDLKQE
ncbi:tripartite tricarboxylate transporter substrate binding protein [Tardiphaga sp. vice352]|uniref:Bug family tripartite tricarboxylate transporter substrate binding protein n=1 Tax=unclassified Tardiphaga TaxID=2631404 RepID=UPI001165AA24|nr:MULTISPECIES: tripartite tricarboxylate transporter substrate-binding protein [unclassified Tardiphaga]QDM15292.1 tripartite tricarboxylate transporter substrate binding protein [Tardiphaga sp. vice278]QDM20375.1 tripartite tricarboxylate transporter substrate binding protein [Tardiphaga sp. vice154]QDM25461.1 tripartite tricarboxylate transporter substrate binding protein [Tardiphaga sp. vice304]QDM30670.1 tripartite tricarboxylate transporter substrate binding protein [Tardiphaga sp. vice3